MNITWVKYPKITLIEKNILQETNEGGRSTNYKLVNFNVK